MIWIEFAVSALVTAATYGAGPMLLALLRKKPLRVRYLRIFSAVYTIAVWAVWQFLTYDGNAVRTMPALLWGYVFYRLARSVLEKKPVPAIPKERWYTCPKCGQLVPEGKPCDCESLSPQPGEKLCGTPFIQAGQTPPGVETEQPKPGKRSPVVPLCIAAALLVVCTCILGYRVSVLTAARDDLAAENAELRSRVSTLSTEKTQLQEKVNDLEARNEDLSGYLHDATFLYNNIGFIVEGSNRYHNYDCPVFQGADEYWAHNIEYCEYLGYSKCGNCW
jgi:hypothetical protein